MTLGTTDIGKPSLKNYMKPRPKKLKILGEWLENIGTASGVTALALSDGTMKTVTIILFAAGKIGNLLTKLFAEPDYENSEDETRI